MEEKETIRPIEITWEELQSRDLDRYILVDTRGDEAVNYGMIPGAIVFLSRLAISLELFR